MDVHRRGEKLPGDDKNLPGKIQKGTTQSGQVVSISFLFNPKINKVVFGNIEKALEDLEIKSMLPNSTFKAINNSSEKLMETVKDLESLEFSKANLTDIPQESLVSTANNLETVKDRLLELKIRRAMLTMNIDHKPEDVKRINEDQKKIDLSTSNVLSLLEGALFSCEQELMLRKQSSELNSLEAYIKNLNKTKDNEEHQTLTKELPTIVSRFKNLMEEIMGQLGSKVLELDKTSSEKITYAARYVERLQNHVQILQTYIQELLSCIDFKNDLYNEVKNIKELNQELNLLIQEKLNELKPF